MRPSIAPGRPSMSGQRSTGLSNRFANQPVDFKRYSIANPGTAQRQSMAPARFSTRPPNEIRTEQAKELIEFFQTHGAVFAYNLKVVKDGPTRNEFRMWFEFIVKMISRNYELIDSNHSMNEEVPALLNCLNYPNSFKNSTMLGLNTPHQWPTFLYMLDWLRKLTLIYQEDEPSGTEKQDYTFKYAFDSFRQKLLTGNEDYTEILAALREIIICSSSYDDLNEEINQAQENIKENEAKIESEGVAIVQVEKEISDYRHEIENLVGSESELKFSLNSMDSRNTEVDNEIKALEEKLQNMRAENEALSKQVGAQPMSAYEAQELLQKRNYLREEHKEKRLRHEKLQAHQVEINKTLTKLATEKTEFYRVFCSELAQQARIFDAEKEYRSFECALFGKNGGADSLRAVQLGSQVSDTFRILINAIRNSVQRRLNEINQLRLDTQLKKLQNDNCMSEQTLQQLLQRNNLDLGKRAMKLREAEIKLKQTEQEYDAAGKQVDEIIKQNNAVSARADTQATLMRQVEAKLSNIDLEETDLLNQFADYMVEATTRFESFSKANSDLAKQKDMLLEISAKIVEHTKLLMKSLPAANATRINNVSIDLDDLSL